MAQILFVLSVAALLRAAAFGPGCVKTFLSTLGAPSCAENRASMRNLGLLT